MNNQINQQINQQQLNQQVNRQVNQKDEGDGKKILAVIVMIGVLMLCTTGATFAYFAIGATNNNTITGTAATVSLNLTVSKTLPTKTNTGVMVPQKSTTATSSEPLGKALAGGCVDSNTNIVCQVYTIKITNNSTATVVLKGYVSFYTNAAMTAFSGMPNLKWKTITSASALGNTSTADKTASMTATEFIPSSTSPSSVSLAANGGNATYYMIVWINETGAAQTDSGTYYGKIEISSSNGTGVTSTFT